MTEALPLPQTLGTSTIPLDALIYTVNKPTLAESISTGTSLTTDTDSIIDASTGALSCTLAQPTSGNQCKTVRLLHRAANTVTISCTASGGGTFQLTPDNPMRKLRYNTGPSCWQIEDGISVTVPTPDSFYPTTQQGVKLAGTAVTGTGNFGYAVALSADGNTMAVGGYGDNTNTGAVWIYTRSVGVWSVQGTKLVGTGITGTGQFGASVALSSDGNTLAVGGSADNTNVGAVWVFTRSGTTWTQQGTKLTGAGETGAAQFGTSVELSADGNTMVVGGPFDNTNIGAVWIFTRSSGTWSAQGAKLVGTGVTGTGALGTSVALSADGNTLAIGGPSDNSLVGATWVFTRSGTTWTQQGTKITGASETGAGQFGVSVDLSSSGNTLAVGGAADNSSVGAVWMYTRTAGSWSAQGSKLVGSDVTGAGQFGTSVVLSSDGNTLVTGGSFDNTSVGAAWVFTRVGTSWAQVGNKLTGTGETGSARFGTGLALSSNGNTVAVGAYRDFGTGASWVFV